MPRPVPGYDFTKKEATPFCEIQIRRKEHGRSFGLNFDRRCCLLVREEKGEEKRANHKQAQGKGRQVQRRRLTQRRASIGYLLTR